MQINRLILENIRSYEQEVVDFNKGITLLSGDIGSGKSTVLLAVEFALFGLMKGQLNSDSILRHGANTGAVTLDFNIGKNNYSIIRSLKRTKTSIKQETGFLVINGSKHEFTPQELRAKLITILGYPADFITKNPSIIYRYTVYTAQEDMKQILSDSSESRLETIRKIFNLDKYKLIRKNIELYNKEISARIREDKARTENMVDLSDDSERLTQEIEIIEKKILDLTDLIKKLNQNLDSKQSDLKNLNEKINIQNKLKQDIASVKSKIESMNSQKKIFEKQLMSLSDLNKSDLFEDKDELKILKDKLILLENNKDKILEKRRDVIQKKAILESRISQSKKTTEKIYSLDVCPTCKQNVTDEHKSSIKQDELNKIKSSEEKLVKLKEIYVLLESRLSSSDEKIKTIQDSITQIQIKHVKIKSLQDKLKLKEQIESNIKKIDSDLKENDKLLINFTDKLDKNLLITFDEKSKEIQKQQQVLKQNEILLSEINKERSFKKEQIKKLKEQLEQKNKIIDKISKNTVLKNWFEKFFLGLMQKMEKHTLTNIQREFNSCFQDWFNLLIEDENINVRLDDSFSPLIEQNGYETSINNLSGGEKTSVALAYRLSLNNVINSFVSNVKTKDLIILDEPTDGFSTQQLDRLRDVLLELKSNQIIIVSHESKLESYADNIIKINKEHHISKLSF